jgi:hypothetical protein
MNIAGKAVIHWSTVIPPVSIAKNASSSLAKMKTNALATT